MGGLEQVIAKRARTWKAVLPAASQKTPDGKTATDAYGRPIRTVQAKPKTFEGFDAPLGEAQTGQVDIGHITRGDRVLYVLLGQAVGPGDLQVGRELEDEDGVRWGIVAVENWAGKVGRGRGKFLRLQITRKALQ